MIGESLKNDSLGLQRILKLRMSSLLLFALSFAPLLSCSSISVSSDYDLSAKFDMLQTYDWMQTSKKPQEGTSISNTLVRSRVRSAVDHQLKLKGYRQTLENPDFLVAYHASVDEKTTFHSVPYYGGGVGFGHMGMGYQDVYQTQYEEGTLILDILDPKSKNLLWRGMAKGVVDSFEAPETKTQQINEAVQKILEQFPPKKNQ